MKLLKKMQRVIITLLAVCLASTFVVACTTADDGEETTTTTTTTQDGDSGETSENGDSTEPGEDSNLNTPGELPIVHEEVTLTIGLPKPSSVEDMNTNWFTLWLEEQTNVDVDFIEYPSTDAATRLEIEITSNQELPDVLWGFWLSDIAEYNYGANGTIIDLLPYYDSNSVYIKEQLEHPDNAYDLYDFMLAADGKMYSVGRLQEETHVEHFHKAFINKTWLDTLGLEVPTTTEELNEVLIAFRDDDPNGNGIQDEIPMVAATNSTPDNVLLNAFIYNNGGDRFIFNDDDEFDVAFTQEAWREGLRYINELIDDGLLAAESYTQDIAQLRQLAQNPDEMIVGVVLAAPIGGMFTGRVADYVTLPALEGPEGIAYSRFSPSFPSKAAQITKYAEDPEVAFQLMDFMWKQEASELQRYGELGVDWEYAEDGDVGLAENIGFPAYRKFTPDGVNSGEFPVQNKWYNFQAPMALRYEVVNGLVDSGEEDYNRLTHGSMAGLVNKRPEKVITRIFYSDAQLDEIAESKTSINTFVNESIARFAVGDLDLDGDWDDYLQELDKMGLERYIEVSREAYEARPIDVGMTDYDIQE